MKFLSIREYFYKLNTISFILLLLPLMVFVFLHYSLWYRSPMISDTQSIFMLLSVAVVILIFDLTIVHWVWRIRMKRLKTLIELAKKMDGYSSLMFLKMSGYCSGSLVMAAGFFVSGEVWFTVIFIINSIAITFQWPTPTRFCRHFELRGPEREMIIHSQDLFQKNKRA